MDHCHFTHSYFSTHRWRKCGTTYLHFDVSKLWLLFLFFEEKQANFISWNSYKIFRSVCIRRKEFSCGAEESLCIFSSCAFGIWAMEDIIRNQKPKWLTQKGFVMTNAQLNISLQKFSLVPGGYWLSDSWNQLFLLRFWGSARIRHEKM